MWNQMITNRAPLEKESKRMKSIQLFVICIIVCISSAVAQDSTVVNTYRFGYYNQYDLRNSSTNALFIHRYSNDLFNDVVRPKMGEKTGNLAFGVFSFASTYMSMIWSHEFGHSLRAAQVGGHFKIHNAALPIPYTTMELPDSIDLVDESLSVTGGFEVNYLNVRTIQSDFIRNNGSSNVSLAFAFANRIMFPLYTSVIVPIDAEDPDVWINTAGDPVHVILPVWTNYSDGQVFMADNSVNPDLVDFYGEAVLLATYFNLLDPHFYKEVAASFGDEKVERKPIWLIGDHSNGWIYGTMFNVSPLGYELYLNNYIHLNGNQFSLYFKTGRPFKNNGAGLAWNNIAETDKYNVSASLETWDQDIFGSGIAGEATLEYKLSQNLGIVTSAGYKTEGYILGKQIAEGFNWSLGVQIFHQPTQSKN